MFNQSFMSLYNTLQTERAPHSQNYQAESSAMGSYSSKNSIRKCSTQIIGATNNSRKASRSKRENSFRTNSSSALRSKSRSGSTCGDRLVAYRGACDFSKAEILMEHNFDLSNQKQIFNRISSPTKQQAEAAYNSTARCNLLADTLLHQEFSGTTRFRELKQDYSDENDSLSFNLASKGDSLINGSEITNRMNILQFDRVIKRPDPPLFNTMKTVQNIARDNSIKGRKVYRPLPVRAEKILDAPLIVNDFYLNNLDWNSQNIVAIGLGRSVYMWSLTTQDISEVCEIPSPGHYMTATAWLPQTSILVCCDSTGALAVYDVDKKEPIRELHPNNDEARVCTVAWNNCVLASGDHHGRMAFNDIRLGANSQILSKRTHRSEICKLKWSDDGVSLASGANDNSLLVWDIRNMDQPRVKLDNEFTAAVKAIDWCPWQRGIIAAGGGTKDQKLRVINAESGAVINRTDTKAQISSVIWNRYDKELATSHGFAKNSICLWRYSSSCLRKEGELKGHSDRILSMALGPDGTQVASTSADETLRIWKLFEKTEGNVKGFDWRDYKEEEGNKNSMRVLQLR